MMPGNSAICQRSGKRCRPGQAGRSVTIRVGVHRAVHSAVHCPGVRKMQLMFLILETTSSSWISPLPPTPLGLDDCPGELAWCKTNKTVFYFGSLGSRRGPNCPLGCSAGSGTKCHFREPQSLILYLGIQTIEGSDPEGKVSPVGMETQKPKLRTEAACSGSHKGSDREPRQHSSLELSILRSILQGFQGAAALGHFLFFCLLFLFLF